MNHEARHPAAAAFAAAACAAAVMLLARCQPQVTGEQYRELQQRIYKLELKTQALEKRVQKLEKKSVAGSGPSMPAQPLPKSTGEAKDVRCKEKEGMYTITPADAELFRKDAGSFLASFRYFPTMEEGQVNGFRLYGIRADSFSGSCGFKNGDVLVKINDRPLSSAEDMLIALKAAQQEEGDLRFQVIRLSQIVEITVSVASGGPKGSD